LLDGIGAAVPFVGGGGTANVVTTKMITAKARTTANLNARLSCAMSASWHQSPFGISNFRKENRES
jgi:hypothetical protein